MGVLVLLLVLLPDAGIFGTSSDGAVRTVTWAELFEDYDDRGGYNFLLLDPGDSVAVRGTVRDVDLHADYTLLAFSRGPDIMLTGRPSSPIQRYDVVELRLTISRGNAYGYEFEWFEEALEPVPFTGTYDGLVFPARVARVL